MVGHLFVSNAAKKVIIKLLMKGISDGEILKTDCYPKKHVIIQSGLIKLTLNPSQTVGTCPSATKKVLRHYLFLNT